MKKTTIVIGIVALFLISLGGCTKQMSLMSYNEKVVGPFNKWSEKMYADREKIYENTLSKEENEALVAEMNTSTDECIKFMDEIKYPEDAKDLQECLLKIYHFQKDSITPLLAQIVSLEPESQAWYDVWNEFDKRLKTVDAYLEEMEGHQKELAKKAGAQLR
jgi:hypothetical protein